MNNLQMESNHSLLLNLLLRETSEWYFFDLVPKHDTKLAEFMVEVSSEKGYVKYEISKNKSAFFPLIYKSLTGMHTFSSKVALRDTNSDSLLLVDYKELLFKLVQSIFGVNKDMFNTVMPKIDKLYSKLQKRSFQRFISKKLISSTYTTNSIKNAYDSVLSKKIFGEYKTIENLKSLHKIISSFANQFNYTKSDASIKWLKNYTNALLKNFLELFFDKGVLVNPSFYYTTVFLNKEMLPFKMEVSKDTPNIIAKNLTAVSLSNLKEDLKSQLLNHHIYPLIRSIGILDLAKEKELLNATTEAFYKFDSKAKSKLDFFENVHTKVTSYLPLIFETKTVYNTKQIHIHNHIHNKKYYSPCLIKPNPGEVVHKRYFNEGTMEIAIRGFDINTDLETLHKWVNLEYAKKFWEMDGPIDELEQEYIKHLGVDYSHPYIGTLDGEPIFTLELYWAIKDIVGRYYPFHPGDYGFHMLIAPAKKRIPNFSYYALTMCMEHFFSYNQVHRMIGEASTEHMGTHNLITKVGCEFNKALVLPYKTSNLTFLTREMYYDAVKDVLKKSTKEK